jgi:hypothetical protein
MESIRNYGNPGTRNVAYFSSATYEECINLLGTKVLYQIKSGIKEAKYVISID